MASRSPRVSGQTKPARTSLLSWLDRLPALPKPTTPVGRAVVPVLAGTAVLALIFGGMWGVATLMAGGDDVASERFAPRSFAVGDVDNVREEIAESGPLIFPNLDSTTADRTVVLDHRGDDATRGWTTSWGYPADTGPSCAITQIEGTDRFTDCNDREIGVDDLARDNTLCPIVEDRQDLAIGLRAELCGPSG